MRWQCVAAVLVLSSPAMYAQAPSQPTGSPASPSSQSVPEIKTEETPATFTSKVNLVLVPVVVRDRQGRALGNLKKEDFQLFDRGKLQVISRFSVEKTGEPAPAAKAPSNVQPGDPTHDGHAALDAMPQRYVAYVFDDLNVQFGDLVRVLKAAVHHLETALHGTDRAAIFTTSGQANLDFTNDRAKLEHAVNNLHPQPRLQQSTKDCPYMTYYLADQIVNKQNQQALQSDIQDAIQCLGLDGVLNAKQMAKQDVELAAQSMIPMGEQATHIELTVLRDVIRRMSALPGQRSIVLTSPGFLTLTTTSFEEKTDVLDRAARANVVIGALDARGLYTDSTFAASARPASTPQMNILKTQYDIEAARENADILAELADGTGGTFVQNTNDFDEAYRRLAAAPEYLYMLGFSPQGLKMDGSFHILKIAVQNVKGTTVQARRGYYAPKRAANEEETAKAEIQDAVFSREEMHDLPVDLHTQFFKPDPADAKLTVLARVDLRHLRFRKLDGRNRNDLTVVAALFDRNGNFVTGSSKIVEMRLRDETLQNLNAGITVRNNFDVKPGMYMIRLVVRDAQGQLMSAENGVVDIP